MYLDLIFLIFFDYLIKVVHSLLKKLFERKTTIPIHYSTDRRTAALGAAWKKGC